MRTHLMPLLSLLGASTIALGCGSHPNVQCGVNSDCDLHLGGACTTAPTENQWCSYPDPSCPGGMRYSDLQVGDGVSGQCVVIEIDAGAPPSAPATSCIALPHTCGPNGSDDCCSSLLVPGGTYFRSYDVAGDSGAGDKSAPATISTFRLDKYEVTVGRFRAFVEASQGTQENPPVTGAGTHIRLPGSGWEASWTQFLPANKDVLITSLKCGATFNHSTWTDVPGPNENLPINCLTWYDAMAFCAWDGAFLPTEAEWNYAAAGGDQQRAYAWSSPPSSIVLDTSHASYDCIEDENAGCTLHDIVDVGTRPLGDGRWGQSDLTGNAMEWTLDWGDPYQNPCIDCAILGSSLQSGGERAIRGGNWTTDMVVQLRTGYRQTASPGEASPDRGMRCARAP